jgi:beta-lactamase class A
VREGWTFRPLSLIAPNAAYLAEQFEGRIGIAVAVPAQGVVYTLNGDEPFEALSVAKVPIMIAFLEQAASSRRPLSDADLALLETMITQSDNLAADVLWIRAGGSKGVHAALSAAGFPNFRLDSGAWGESSLTAEHTATLLAALVDGSAFHPDTRRIAVDLMSRVVAWQAWGAGTGLPGGTAFGVKNGWYLEDGGWALHTTGFVLPEPGTPYTIAIYNVGGRSYYPARAVIEALSSALHADVIARLSQ